eukprot:COSAG05_NODE_3178_length_2265_cov_1.265466_3_plen_106_part_00
MDNKTLMMWRPGIGDMVAPAETPTGTIYDIYGNYNIVGLGIDGLARRRSVCKRVRVMLTEGSVKWSGSRIEERSNRLSYNPTSFGNHTHTHTHTHARTHIWILYI